jgi:hypothetical protein
MKHPWVRNAFRAEHGVRQIQPKRMTGLLREQSAIGINVDRRHIVLPFSWRSISLSILAAHAVLALYVFVRCADVLESQSKP